MNTRDIVTVAAVVMLGVGIAYWFTRDDPQRFESYLVHGKAPWCSVARLRLPRDNDLYCRWLSERQCAVEIEAETMLCVENPLR